jgi:hypothetical protein
MMDKTKDAELAELKARLAALEHQPTPVTPPKTGGLGKVVMWTLIVVVGGFVGLVILGSMLPQETGADRAARIEKACNDEFSPDQDAVNRCKIALIAHELEKDQDERIRRAAQAAGQ